MANIKSIGGNPIVLDASGIAPGAVTPDKLADMGGITAGAALGITGNDAEESAWLARTSEADGVASVRSIHGNTIVQDGELLPVNMTGIESTGFNQWDEEWELGSIDTSTGEDAPSPNAIRSKNYIPVFPATQYYFQCATSNFSMVLFFYDADKNLLSSQTIYSSRIVTIPDNCHFMRFRSGSYGTTYNHDICINISDPTRNGTYEPYWQQTRSIPAGTLRGAGTVYDEQTETERIVRVGEVDLGTLTWTYTNAHRYYSDGIASDILLPANSSTMPYATAEKYRIAPSTISLDANTDVLTVTVDSTPGRLVTYAESADAPKPSGLLHYALAAPTVTPYDPPLNLTYRTETGGTERVIVPTGEQSAPPAIVAAQGYTAESLRDAALSAIAPVENGRASTNYGVGSYLVHGGQLCKVTTAIATGEAITIGTNVTATTAMAEVIALIAQ